MTHWGDPTQELERKVGQLTVEHELLKKTDVLIRANVGGDRPDEGAGRSAQRAVPDVERLAIAWIERYNTERQHSTLGYLTPRAWREQFSQLPQAA
jgi:transposase InsO family protein